MRTKIYSIIVFLFLMFSVFILMHLVQTNHDMNLKKLEKEAAKDLIETKNKKHIDTH